MRISKKLQQFLHEYEQYFRHVLKPTYDEVKQYLKQLEDSSLWNLNTIGSTTVNQSPIRMTMIRIKRPEATVDKISRSPDKFPDGLSSQSLKKMCDTIGVRILVYFLSQLPHLDRKLRNSEMFEISKEIPPEAYMEEDLLIRLGLSHLKRKKKGSGYSSIHYTVRLTQSSIPKKNRPFFEIQVRTLAQELWSEMEHMLVYKPENRANFSAKRRFEILSRELNVIDEHFNLLYEEFLQRRETVEYGNTDMLNSENLPAILAEIGIKCPLKDHYDIIKILSSRGINTVGDILEVATPDRIEAIRNTYFSSTGHAPGHLEILAILGSIKGAKTVSAEIERIKVQIEYHRSWNTFKKELSNRRLHQKQES
jgi:putative GTP pyrophosphokinase